mmetsp:Transcript_23794/g.36129  ORF Transcript_23794/g.36129 Transcript_23794/m.36129 type:complete len:122 (-) Transcript_23794:2251-2616(-)
MKHDDEDARKALAKKLSKLWHQGYLKKVDKCKVLMNAFAVNKAEVDIRPVFAATASKSNCPSKYKRLKQLTRDMLVLETLTAHAEPVKHPARPSLGAKATYSMGTHPANSLVKENMSRIQM